MNKDIHNNLIDAFTEIEACFMGAELDSFWADMIRSAINEALLCAVDFGVSRGAALATIEGTAIQ